MRWLKMRKLIASLTSICVLIAPTLSYAGGGIGGLLDNIVGNNLSYSQPPGIFKSPTNNVLTFGSYSFRMNNNLMNTPILSYNPPRASISCAGADFDTGWLSVLNFDDFSNILQDAGKELVWGIVLGMVYSLPGVADTFQKVNEWGRYFQNLSMDSCMTGMQLGKTIGSEIWARGKTKAQGEAQASLQNSSFEATLKDWVNDIKEYRQLRKFFGDVPYGTLFQAGFEDQEIDDLIASLFGVLDWRAIDPKTGNICTSKDCLKDANIRVSYSPPLITDLNTLINGGTLTLYHCDWGYNSEAQTYMCLPYYNSQTGKYEYIRKKEVSLNGGLRYLVRQKIDGIVQDMANGHYHPDQYTAGWIASVPLPGFADMLNYLVILKKRGFTTEYEDAIDGISELISAIILKSLVNSAHDTLNSVGTYLADKDANKDIVQEQANIDKAAKWIDSYISKKMQENYFLIQTAAKTYQNLRAHAEQSFYKKFGETARLFMNQ